MPPTIPNQVNQSPSKPSNKKWIVIGVVVVAVLAGLQFLASMLLNPAKLMEMAIEHETGADIDIARDGSAIRGTGPDGEKFDISTGEALSVPEKWPSDIPVMDGGRIIQSAAMGQGDEAGMFIIYETSKSAAEVIAFYKAELTKQGFDSRGEMATLETATVGFLRNKEEVGVTVHKSSGKQMNSVQVMYQAKQ